MEPKVESERDGEASAGDAKSRRSIHSFETQASVPMEGYETEGDANEGERNWLLGGNASRLRIRMGAWYTHVFEGVPAWWNSRSKHTQRVIKTVVASFSIALLLILLLSWAVPEAEQEYSQGNEGDMDGTGDGYGGGKEGIQDPDGQTTSDGGGMGEGLCDWERYQLPDAVVPTHYDLHMNVPLEDPWIASGNVIVHVDIRAFTRCIVMHAADMNITSAYLQTEFASGLDKVTANFRADAGQVILELDAPVNPSKAFLNIHFNYQVKEDLRGLYKSKYQQEDRVNYMAVTQFESVDARRAFPCFDEPALKATFNVSLTVPEGSASLFNTRELSRTSVSGKSIRTFQKTPVMSTYLLAMIVARDLIGLHKNIGERTISVWAVPSHGKERLEFALETASTILPYYESMFGIDFPLDKLDLVAIPDFSAGAMENWGLITYRETDLLVQEGNSSKREFQNVALVIAHEMAHQWFGNLVTMEWWDDLWLNEGFASYIEYVGATAAHPEFRVMEQFFPMSSTVALEADSVPSTHPIHVGNVSSDAVVDSLFDDISYSKGASLIRMLRTYMFSLARPGLNESGSDDPFMEGVRHYLQTYKYRNAKTRQLWKTIEGVSSHPVEQWMESWSVQKGFPVLSVVTDKSTGNIKLVQTPFQVGGIYNPTSMLSNCSDSPSQHCWWIPVSWRRKSLPSHTSWRIVSDRSVGLGVPYNCSDWIKFNVGQTGFYRVAYSGSGWYCLGEASRSATDIPSVDLAGLLDDADALSTIGQISIASLTKLLDALPHRDEDALPEWRVASRVSKKLLSLLEEAESGGDSTFECMDGLRKWASNIFRAPLSRIGSDGQTEEPVVNTMLRPLLMETIAHLGDEEMSVEAYSLVLQYVNGSEPIDPGLRLPYFVLAAQSGVDGYEAMETIYQSTADPQEKNNALYALSQVRRPELINRTLALSIGPTVRSQDLSHLLISVSQACSTGRTMAWEFFKENYQLIVNKKGGVSAGGSMASLVSGITRGFASIDMVSEITAFYENHPEARVERLEQEAQEKILANSEWLKRNHAGLCSFLSRSEQSDASGNEQDGN